MPLSLSQPFPDKTVTFYIITRSSEKKRPVKDGKRVPMIQTFARIKVPTGKPGQTANVQVQPSKLIHPMLMKNFLLQKKTCTDYLNACSDGSLNEALNGCCKKMSLS